MTLISLHLKSLGWLIGICFLLAKFFYETFQMWNWNKYKILYCEWCFNFWFSILFSFATYFIESSSLLVLIPFIVPPLNFLIDGIIQRH